MALNLNAEQKSILNIFANVEYLIPNYQRPYSWDEQNCQILWDDLFNIFEDSSMGNEKDDGYFLGNIVLARGNDNKGYCEVIDGQQRLITIVLLAKALSLYDDKNTALENILWAKNRRDESDKKQRVKTAVFEESDNDNLKECLEIEDINFDNKKSKFHANITYFLSELKKQRDKFDLQQFIDFLLDKVFLLPIETKESTQDKARNSALTIFETINNRGLDLSDADIFKAQIYSAAINISKQDDFIERWNEMAKRCDAINYKIDDVFRVYMHIIRGKNADIKVEKSLRVFFTTDGEYTKALKKQNYSEIMSDLEKIVLCVEYYCILLKKPSSDTDKEISKWLEIINVYSNNIPKIAIFIYLFKNIQEDNLPNKNIDDFILYIKNLIRYVYKMGATTTVKFEIYKVIKDTMDGYSHEYEMPNKELEFYCKLKKGFLLIYLYERWGQGLISEYFIDSIGDDPRNIGNYLVVDRLSYLSRKKSIHSRQQVFRKSSIIELKEYIADKIENWDERLMINREKDIKATIDNFLRNKE